MRRKAYVREDVFKRDAGLWWLNKEKNSVNEKNRTTMSAAMRNAGVSSVIDVKFGGLSTSGRKQRRF
jgi:hypothetical protein